MVHHIIKTTIDPKEIRAKYGTIVCRDGEFETTATAEIMNEDFDPKTKMFTMEIGLNYRRRSTRNTISLPAPARQDGKRAAIKPPDYMLTQVDFDEIMKGEIIAVPALD